MATGHLEKAAKESAPQITIRQEPQAALSKDVGSEHKAFMHMLRNKAAVVVTSGMIAVAALTTLTSCGTPIKLVQVNPSLVGEENGNTLTSGYKSLLLKNGASVEVVNAIQSQRSEAINSGDVYVFDNNGKITVFYEDQPNKEVREDWFIEGKWPASVDQVREIENSIQRSLSDMKIDSPDPESPYFYKFGLQTLSEHNEGLGSKIKHVWNTFTGDFGEIVFLGGVVVTVITIVGWIISFFLGHWGGGDGPGPDFTNIIHPGHGGPDPHP